MYPLRARRPARTSTCRRPARGWPHAITYPWPVVAGAPGPDGRRPDLGPARLHAGARGRGARHRRHDPRLPPRAAGRSAARVPLIKGVASIITIGTGGSAGQEGPIAQIGAGFGSFLARLLRLHAERAPAPDARRRGRRGIGAIFRAPLGGALFAGEVLYSTHRDRVGGAAALPGQLDRRLLDVRPVHHAPADLHRPRPGLPRPARAAPVRACWRSLCAAVGWLYVRVFYGLRD